MSIPTGGAEVQQFSPHRPLPRFADSEAKSVYLAAHRAFRNIHLTKVVVTRPDKNATIYISGGKLRQNTQSNSWVYDGKTLTILVNHKLFRGKASRADTLDYLALLTNGEDSLTRSILLRSNLVDAFMASNATVRISGKMSVRGVPATVLEVNGPGGRSSLVIRNSDHLIASADTDSFTPNGKAAFHDECLYDYYPFQPTRSLFTLTASTKPTPLPKSAIKISTDRLRAQLQR
jgi:hypothetical protein